MCVCGQRGQRGWSNCSCCLAQIVHFKLIDRNTKVRLWRRVKKGSRITLWRLFSRRWATIRALTWRTSFASWSACSRLPSISLQTALSTYLRIPTPYELKAQFWHQNSIFRLLRQLLERGSAFSCAYRISFLRRNRWSNCSLIRIYIDISSAKYKIWEKKKPADFDLSEITLRFQKP